MNGDVIVLIVVLGVAALLVQWVINRGTAWIDKKLPLPSELTDTAHGPARCKYPKTCEAPCCYCHPSVAWEPNQ